MNNDEYRKFWERLLGRYPDFKPTIEQTEDWRRELQGKDYHVLEAAVATVVKEKSSNIPRLPWIENAYRRVKDNRAAESRKLASQTQVEKEVQEMEKIQLEKKANLKQLRETPIEDLRAAATWVIKKYDAVFEEGLVEKPKDGNVDNWSKYFRASVWVRLYGSKKHET